MHVYPGNCKLWTHVQDDGAQSSVAFWYMKDVLIYSNTLIALLMQENRCFSPTSRQYVDNMDEHVNSDCYDEENMVSLAGFGLELCEPTVACPAEPFFKYSPYGPCNASCPAGDLPCGEDRTCTISGSKIRVGDCVKNEDDQLVDAAGECSETPELEASCEVNCRNSVRRFTKTQGPCVSAACDVEGTVDSIYTECPPEGGRGCMLYDGITEEGTVTEACPAKPCDACILAPCENAVSWLTDDNGKCQCECEPGFFGSRCHLQEGQSYSVRDASGMTCLSMVTDRAGNCCDNAVELDSCGYCTGIEIADLGTTRVGYDIDGKCCSSSTSADVFLTGDFTCCESPDLLDECGICMGNGDTCFKTVAGTIDLADGRTVLDFTYELRNPFPQFIQEMLLAPGEDGHPGRRLQEASEVSYVLQVGSSMTTLQLSGAYIDTGIQASTGDSAILSSTPPNPTPSVMGNPGDGECGVGETPQTSPGDCHESLTCPQATASETDFGMVYIGSPALPCSAKGSCIPLSGTCDCNDGYVGDACDRCDEANGYVIIPLNDEATTFACTTTASDHPPMQQDVPPGTPPAAGDPPATDSKKKGLGMGALIGIIVGAVGGVVIIAGAAFFVLRMRAGKEVSPV